MVGSKFPFKSTMNGSEGWISTDSFELITCEI